MNRTWRCARCGALNGHENYTCDECKYDGLEGDDDVHARQEGFEQETE
jgi:hypothetical protein